MEPPWTVRGAWNAGQVLRPDSKDANANVDADSHKQIAETSTASQHKHKPPSSTLGTIVALVTRREPTSYVYCKRTHETVPCVTLRIADDTYDGLRLTLWRGHAGVDVGT